MVLSARRQGKRVILGGHSLGASMTVAYASWDFDGHPGYEDLDGLVLIDGGLLGSFSTPDLAATKKAIKALDTNGPFVDLLGLKLPWAAGVFAETGAIPRCEEPTAPSTAQSFPLLPAAFKPPIPATNRGLLGYALDASTSPKALALIHVRAGTLGPNGDWVDGEVTPIARLAQTFGQEPANATEWYFPAKLSIDVDAVNALTRNAQSDFLRLRPWHRRAVDLPLYALQTDLTHGQVLRGARRFIAGSKIPRGRSVLVDASATESHLDPLTAAPERNRFLQTVVPFLRKLRASTAMSERTSYEPGVPTWVDLASPDTDASAAFYGGLFGWELQSAGPVEETGGYGMFTLRGKQVAGVGPIMQEGQPPAWSVYIATDDADAAAERAAARAPTCWSSRWT